MTDKTEADHGHPVEIMLFPNPTYENPWARPIIGGAMDDEEYGEGVLYRLASDALAELATVKAERDAALAQVAATPAAKWRTEGQADPHAGHYDCERASLPMGYLTDDEMANAVYLFGDEKPPLADILSGKAKTGQQYLDAAKNRIRWLSRKLSEANSAQAARDARVRAEALREGYLAGFNAAGEGYNGEYPFAQYGKSPIEDEGWVIGRDMWVDRYLAAAQDKEPGHG